MNIKDFLNFYNNMGFKYFKFRSLYELEKRLGILKKKYPIYPNPKNEPDYEKAKEHFGVLSEKMILEKVDYTKSSDLEHEVKRILSGDVKFFNSSWINLGVSYDWVTNPSTNYSYSIKKHWTEIPDFSIEAGDIKFVWEKSRFSWLLKIIRYDQTYNTDHSEFVFSEIESWIDHNPINMGPNWRCSQEISLRNVNWFFAFIYYYKSPFFTKELWEKIYKVVFSSLDHVYKNINFSRIAVRNNHAITETLFLTLSELMFPFIKETTMWAKKGRKWFEEEISYQIYEDGTFLQFSMNYHRVVIQLLTLGINLSEIFGKPFTKVVYDRAYKSLKFLYECMQDVNGYLPNYGSNDGALFFPWSNSDYRDYRPQLNSLHYLLTGVHLFEEKEFSEESILWSLKPSSLYSFSKLIKLDGIMEFPIGGYVIIRDGESFTFLRCGSHRDRPAQADNLHIDIWINGVNLIRDSGTYKYNTDLEYINYFTGTSSHNTVVVNNEAQMKKGQRFIWFYWTQKLYSNVLVDDYSYEFSGKIKTYSFLHNKGEHFRKVKKIKGINHWIIEDEIYNLDEFNKKQYWHFNSMPQIKGEENNVQISSQEGKSYDSKYYGELEKGQAIFFEFEKAIETTIKY